MLEFLKGLDANTWAAGFSALATFFAAYAAWRGPTAAAVLAEKLRKASEKALEVRRQKLYVFSTIMRERSAQYSAEAVGAFNLIDVVFNESAAVRDAWAEFYAALEEKNQIPPHAKEERLRKMLSLMAKDVGLSDALRLADFDRFYMPNALAEEQYIRTMQRAASLRQIQGGGTPSGNSAPQILPPSNYPPPPSS